MKWMGWDNQMRDLITIEHVHVRSADGWRRWNGIVRWEILKDLTKLTYWLKMYGRMGWDDQMIDLITIERIHVHPEKNGMIGFPSAILNNWRTILASTMKMFRKSTTLWSLGQYLTSMMSFFERNRLSHRRLKSPRWFSKRKLTNNNSYHWNHPSSTMTPKSISWQCGHAFLWARSVSSPSDHFSTTMLITSTVLFSTTSKPQLLASTSDFPSLVEMLYLWSLTMSSPHFPLK